jgi:hypothetical protein
MYDSIFFGVGPGFELRALNLLGIDLVILEKGVS